MNKKFLALIFLAAGSAFAARVDFSVNIGIPPPPPRVEVRPAVPGRDYVWVDGYWYPDHGRWEWRPGFWRRPPHRGDRWIAPQYDNGRWREPYWGDERHPNHHDFDRDRGRHDRDRDHDRR